MLRERERGLDAVEDELHAGTFGVKVSPGEETTVLLSAEAEVPLAARNGETARKRRERHEAQLLAPFHEPSAPRTDKETAPGASESPGFIRQLVLAADAFVVKRPIETDPDGMTILAGYPWFGDWGRDTILRREMRRMSIRSRARPQSSRAASSLWSNIVRTR